MIVHCKDPYLQEWVLTLNNTPPTNGYTMKVEQRRPSLKPENIYALAHTEVSNREALDRLNRGEKWMVTYTHRPSPHETAVNAIYLDATANHITTEPTDTSVNTVGLPKPKSRKTANPGSTPPPSNQPVWVLCSQHWKKRRQTAMDYRIHWVVTNGTLCVCKPDSTCNNSHGAVPQSPDWAVKEGKRKGGEPNGVGGDKSGVGAEGGGGDKGGKGALYGRGRW